MTTRTFKSLLSLIVLCLSAWERPACAQQAAQAAPKAVTPVVKYKFGDVRRGEALSFIFPIKNEGTADLIIKEFTPS